MTIGDLIAILLALVLLAALSKWRRKMDARIQRAIDAIAAEKTISESINLHMAETTVAVKALKDEIVALKDKLAGTVPPEDFAALEGAAGNLEDLTAAEKDALLANTEEQPPQPSNL